MDEPQIRRIFQDQFHRTPDSITRCGVGLGNYVYAIADRDRKYIFRCSPQPEAYANTIHWLDRLAELDIPAPRILAQGRLKEFDWLILSYIDGEELGTIYPQLSQEEKRTIAKEITSIQKRVAELALSVDSGWSWRNFVLEMLDRAEYRIRQSGYFDPEIVTQLRELLPQLDSYFAAIRPIPYLDDISSKNLIIQNGHVAGIIDVDWIGKGDSLTFAALTNMALLDMEYDTQYVSFLLDEMQLTPPQHKAFLFYTLMYCVDFMGERGMQFVGRTVPVTPDIISKLNRIYDQLWYQWAEKAHT